LSFCLSEFLATDPEVLGSIPGATRFSEKQWGWKGVHSLMSITEELLEWKSSGSGSRKSRLTAVGVVGDSLRCPYDTLYKDVWCLKTVLRREYSHHRRKL
jgi:hypothetical protein